MFLFCARMQKHCEGDDCFHAGCKTPVSTSNRSNGHPEYDPDDMRLAHFIYASWAVGGSCLRLNIASDKKQRVAICLKRLEAVLAFQASGGLRFRMANEQKEELANV